MGLTLLEVNPEKLDCDVIEKNLKGGDELFPHILGTVPVGCVSKVYPLPVEGDGSFELPVELHAEFNEQVEELGLPR
jgi:uncharacterized protein (DUF952 family)